MKKTPPDADKKKARNEKRAEAMMQDEPPRPELTLVENTGQAGAAPSPKGSGMKTRELIDVVTASTGAKKTEVRRIVEATLEAVGVALATGKDLNLPPLGKLRMAKNKPPVMTLKLRLADGPKAAGLALADEDEDS